MEKNKKKNLRRIVKKLKNDAAKNALSAVEVHPVDLPAPGKTEAPKPKVKIKKTKKIEGDKLDGKKEKALEENKVKPSGVPGGAQKSGGNERPRGLKDPNWWPWERD